MFVKAGGRGGVPGVHGCFHESVEASSDAAFEGDPRRGCVG